MIIDELGTGLAGRADDLNSAIRRAVPALRETDRSCGSSASQNTGHRATSTAERRHGHHRARQQQARRRPLGHGGARHRRDLGRRRDARCAAVPRPPRLPAPSCARRWRELGADRRRADARAARTSSAAAGQLRTLPRATSARSPRPPGRPSARSARRETGRAGGHARRSRPSSRLRQFASQHARSWARTWRSSSSTSTTASARSRTTRAQPAAARATPAWRRCWRYFFDQSLAINIYDANCYILKVALFADKCAAYADAQRPGRQGATRKCARVRSGPTSRASPAALDPTTTARPRARAEALEPKTRRRRAPAAGTAAGGGRGGSGGGSDGGSGGGTTKPPIDVGKTLDRILGGGAPKLPPAPRRSPPRRTSKVPAPGTACAATPASSSSTTCSAHETPPPSQSIVANPVLVGAVTVLVVVVAVFLAYNANNGLPFVPTRELNVECRQRRQAGEGQRGARGRLPRGRGQRHGARAACADGAAGAQVDAQARQEGRRLPVDTTLQDPAALGAGAQVPRADHGARASRPSATAPRSRSARPSVPVDLDEVFNMFDTPTRRAAQRQPAGLRRRASRAAGSSIKRTIEASTAALGHLAPVMRNLRSRHRARARFFQELGRRRAHGRPGGRPAGAAVHRRWPTPSRRSRSDPAGAPGHDRQVAATLDVSTARCACSGRSWPTPRPVARPRAPPRSELRRALPPSTARSRSARRCCGAPSSSTTSSQGAIDALRDLAQDPGTNAALRGLTATVGDAEPASCASSART